MQNSLYGDSARLSMEPSVNGYTFNIICGTFITTQT